LRYFTPLLLGAVVVTNIVKIVTGLSDMDRIGVISNIVFGWGTVVIMIGASVIFYKRKWTTNAQQK